MLPNNFIGVFGVIDEELVKTAANKYGFNLEFKTKSIFEKNGFCTKHNVLVKLNDESLEIDLLANKYVDRHFIIECKGTDSSSALILVKESVEQDNMADMRRRNIEGTNFRLVGFEGENFCTFTGDFFNNNTKELKKSSRNDDENNFYKAQLQINDAISAFIQSASSGVSYITPVIVTNASIWVVDYNNPDKTEVDEFRWVLHKVKLGNNFKFVSREEESEVLSFILPVVNINYLDSFIKDAINMNTSTGRIKISPLSI
ncbi:hypothetical protein [Legionella worsleiensis]|uniref:Uncharacterized protein n=1 Tax=Legionella worsleiensis TaxID=45076 RepID=A0A0W1A340_9GAMM|nr:hypothetical protein [Legionella worsleiensis]KTD75771.1 hypothetical protein Lwor_2337 [Legionella worsleiensis]STY32788.1 Uncharacterised protein [Legionella worsleiensis]